MTKDEFILECGKMNVFLTEQNMRDLEIYKDMLISYNQKFNLTAIKTEEDIYLKHFYDSLTICKATTLKENLKLLDIGTWAGFPGLVLKIVFPKLDVVLLDSNHKKGMFLEDVIKRLGLKRIKVLTVRAEELDKTYREYFDIVTSRAVAHLRILTELSIPYLKVGGMLIAMKGNVLEEVAKSKIFLEKLNSKISNIIHFNLPKEESNRSLVIIEKLAKTSDIYPRSYDKIMKNRI